MAYHNNFFLKFAIADAYGMGFEFVPQSVVDQENNLSTYRPHGLHSSLSPGQYTDDTQMSLALFEYLKESLLEIDYPHLVVDEISNKEKIASKFLEVFKRDPRKGYAKGFQHVLETVSSGEDLVKTIEAYGKTESNGACMRAIPAGLFFRDEDSVLKFSKIQAEVTHRDSAVISAQAVSLAAFGLRKGIRIKELPGYINEILMERIDWSWDGSRVNSKTELGLITAMAAIHTLMTTEGYSDCLKKAVSYGGDTDSVAAIACGLTVFSLNHFDQKIPNRLIDGLERGKFGCGFLYNLY